MNFRHCEGNSLKQSSKINNMDCFALLAMTNKKITNYIEKWKKI